MAGLQCHRQLWWRVHDARAPELKPDAMQQAVFDRGTRVGELARDQVPGGVLIDLPFYRFQQKAEATRAAIDGGAEVIYEASFLVDGLFAAVDILEHGPGGWVLAEVKSNVEIKPPHIPDAAFQTYLVEAAGLPVARTELMHLNRDCVFPDLDNLFTREDVTEGVKVLVPGIEDLVAAQFRALEGDLPEVETGDHCHKPYECPFLKRCWPEPPPHHVSTLHGVRKTLIREMLDNGWEVIQDLPDDLELNPQASRQRRAVKEAGMVVEPGLLEALAAFDPPLSFLDFETVMPAVPVWDGCHPYQQVPVQFSCHVQDGKGGFDHREWLAEGPDDPREALARQLVAACRGKGTILAYNAVFERRCVAELAEAVPHLATDLLAIEGRIDDLLPVVRDHVYHPDMNGSFSLKSVLPALVPTEGYDGLNVSEGATASFLLESLLLGEGPPTGDESDFRRDLLDYCRQDTWSMVRLYDRLREVGKGR